MNFATLDDRVHLALAESPFLTRRKLRFEASEGRVVLRGTVNSYFAKQMAQETLRHVEGVDAIENQLEVAWAHGQALFHNA
jgi:osmotically-inducible protein OsmY